ncbi:MAG: class I SAM-dependent methyltransferase [Pseudomonadota bacterium]
MSRSQAQLRHHFEVEKALAHRLRNAGREERRSLYTDCYNELFACVPDHPQLQLREAMDVRAAKALRQVRFLRSLIGEQARFEFLEVGPGDCLISRTFADSYPQAQVSAVDVSDSITSLAAKSANMRVMISDGCSVPVPAGSIDLVFSNQLMEHLHPEDAVEQLKNIFTALRPGGRYFCITPNRMSGPHDISQHFVPVAVGFHLKEYTVGELKALFETIGFVNCSSYIGLDGVYLRLPVGLIRLVEKVCSLVPQRWRMTFGKFAPVRLVLGIRLLAQKPPTA